MSSVSTIAALREELIGRLDDALAHDVIPARMAQEKDDLDPRVSVGAQTVGGDRVNSHYAPQVQGRVIIDHSPAWQRENGLKAADELLEQVEYELTRHESPWGYVDGSISVEEYQFNDNLSRYVAVAEATFRRIDARN